MAAQPVEWVLVVYYGPEAHRAAYGRQVRSNRYTKDYVQLSRKRVFLETLNRHFPGTASGARVDLTLQWSGGTMPCAFDFSSDRWHLKWDTHRRSAPQAWKMHLRPSEDTAETIPGDPSHLDFSAAENEFALLASRGAGQPYLLAVKLRDEPNRLHLRAYLKNPSEDFVWADLRLLPEEIQALALRTSQRSALAWSTFQGGGILSGPRVADALSRLIASENPRAVIESLDAETGRALADYLRHPGYGIFFSPNRNHDAWLQSAPLPETVAASAGEFLLTLDACFPPTPDADAAAETLDADPDEVDAFRKQIDSRSFAVPDSTATVKTRGSAQKAFADVVKANYEFRCAITGSDTRPQSSVAPSAGS